MISIAAEISWAFRKQNKTEKQNMFSTLSQRHLRHLVMAEFSTLKYERFVT